MAKTACLSFVLLAGLLSCTQHGTARPAAVKPDQPSEAEVWQRIKDCAARVDAMKDEEPSPNLQQGRIAHYSRKYGRCFVKLTMTMVHVPKDNRPDSIMLMDAFEGSVGAMVPFVPPRFLGGKQEDCAKAEAFIDDAMTN